MEYLRKFTERLILLCPILIATAVFGMTFMVCFSVQEMFFLSMLETLGFDGWRIIMFGIPAITTVLFYLARFMTKRSHNSSKIPDAIKEVHLARSKKIFKILMRIGVFFLIAHIAFSAFLFVTKGFAGLMPSYPIMLAISGSYLTAFFINPMFIDGNWRSPEPHESEKTVL